jgi:high-affinity nickel permease
MDFANTAPIGIALLGLLMGMRHATDPDHVIAVTTIVSRERRLLTASRIGVVWGLGHTLTVLAVGALIILFKIAIPVRLGLAMEFAVAIVLILLGMGATARLLQRLARRAGLTGGGDSLIVHSHTHAHSGHPH